MRFLRGFGILIPFNHVAPFIGPSILCENVAISNWKRWDANYSVVDARVSLLLDLEGNVKQMVIYQPGSVYESERKRD